MTHGPKAAVERVQDLSVAEVLPPVPAEVSAEVATSATPSSQTKSARPELTTLSLSGTLSAVPEVERSTVQPLPRERVLKLSSNPSTAPQRQRNDRPSRGSKRRFNFLRGSSEPISILDRLIGWIVQALQALIDKLLRALEAIPVIRHLHPQARTRVKAPHSQSKKSRSKDSSDRIPAQK